MGKALGALHSQPLSESYREHDAWFSGQPAWILTIHRPRLWIFWDASQAKLQLVKLLQHSSEFSQLLDNLWQDWQADRLIYFDIKWDNWIVFAPGSGSVRRKTRLKLVDWELAGLGETRYRRAAEDAFAYERFWFNAEQGNWPDFREESRRSKRQRPPLTFSTFWCHGAPGIGLTRLRAYEILDDANCKAEASVALRTTATMIETALATGNGNFSLCHGLTGNAEILLYARQAAGPAAVLALAVGETGYEIARRRGGIWSCGVTAGETPGLMLGLAGIGYFYVRLHNPATPSILLLRHEDFSPSTGQSRVSPLTTMTPRSS